MSKSKLVSFAAVAMFATATAGPASGAATSAPPKPQMTPPDVCVSGEAGEIKRSWCARRVRVKVRRKPSATGPRVKRPRVKPGRVTPPTVKVDARPGHLSVQYTRPEAEAPQVTPPSVTPGSVDPGELDVDTGLREG